MSIRTQFAAVAAILLMALTIGIIAFLRNQPQSDVVIKNPPAPSPVIRETTTATSDELASNAGRKSPKAQPRETGPTDRKPNSRIKPARERSAPKPLPQVQTAAPPTYAFVNEPNRANGTTSVTEAASHFEQSELLLRAFRNLRPVRVGGSTEIAYERRTAISRRQSSFPE